MEKEERRKEGREKRREAKEGKKEIKKEGKKEREKERKEERRKERKNGKNNKNHLQLSSFNQPQELMENKNLRREKRETKRQNYSGAIFLNT